MKFTNNLYCFILIVFTGILMAGCSQYSGKSSLDPKPSPLYIASMKKNDTYIKITYSRPQKRGRTVFGEGGIVPYGEVWRTGANEATELTTTKDIRLKGNNVPAGTYSLYTIPGQDSWTIILNRAVGQWGAEKYDPSKDLIRLEVPATTSEETWEAFTIQLNKDAMEMRLMWDKTRVSIPISI